MCTAYDFKSILINWVVLQSMVSDIAVGLACNRTARAARYTLMLSNACAKLTCHFPAVRSLTLATLLLVNHTAAQKFRHCILKTEKNFVLKN